MLRTVARCEIVDLWGVNLWSEGASKPHSPCCPVYGPSRPLGMPKIIANQFDGQHRRPVQAVGETCWALVGPSRPSERGGRGSPKAAKWLGSPCDTPRARPREAYHLVLSRIHPPWAHSSTPIAAGGVMQLCNNLHDLLYFSTFRTWRSAGEACSGGLLSKYSLPHTTVQSRNNGPLVRSG